MKFKLGDSIDSEHCTALKHEFLRCEDGFKDFETYGTLMIMKAQAESQGQPPTSAHEKRLVACKTYNAYSRFILHLYEFILGAVARVARDAGVTAQLRADLADRYIAGHAERILTGRRRAMENGTAPAWENHISYYPDKVPSESASKFRELRNKCGVHVTHERSSISLSEFYEKYHKFVHMLYWDGRGHWGLRSTEFPALKEITRFSVLVQKQGLS